MHISALGPTLVMPSGQGMHPRFVVSVGAAETNSPLGQSVHGVHALALLVVLKPVSQCVHTLSLVELPIIDR
jgi:hypothetical protein